MDYAARLKYLTRLADTLLDIAFERGYDDEIAWRRYRRMIRATTRYRDAIRGIPRMPHQIAINCIYHPLNAENTEPSHWFKIACQWSEMKWTIQGRNNFYIKYASFINKL